MRSMWKGAISFGLVSIPVKLYSATQENDLSFHQVHRTDGARVRYKRVCSADGEEVAYADIAKGYELPSGETVILTDDDFAELPLPTSRSIEVLQFVPLEEVDPLYFAKSYYLEPDRTGNKPYVLLRQALQDSGRVALVKVALRQRESLAALRVVDGVLVLETMLWPDEIRTPDFPFLDEEIEVRDQELKMASSLIESLAGPFEPEQYSDGYREALQAVIDAKVEGRQVVVPPEQEEPGQVLDLMAALRASVAKAKGQPVPDEAADDGPVDEAAGAGADESAAPARKAPTKQATTKQAPTKTAPTKQATTKTATTKKATTRKATTTTEATSGASGRKAPAKKAPAKKAPAKKAPAKKGPAQKAPARTASKTGSRATSKAASEATGTPTSKATGKARPKAS